MGAEVSTAIDTAWSGEDAKTINQIGELIPSLIPAGQDSYNNPDVLKNIVALDITKTLITKADLKTFVDQRFAEVETDKLEEVMT
jgi:hypothetical protein